MAMLAERKRKQKWSLNPRGKHWSDDVNKFGQKMLEKMGWSAGKGLGRHEDGMTEHVKVNYKNDSRGMGFKDNGEQWTKHENNFSSLLESLSGSGNNSDTTIQKPDRSLEEKSRSSRARVHYHKFTRGKDLSLKSEKDLANIFGRKTLEKPVEPVKESEPEPETSENKQFGVVTVAAGSMTDYFKSKLGKITNAFTNDNKNTEDDGSESESEIGKCAGFGFGSQTTNQFTNFVSATNSEQNGTSKTENMDTDAIEVVKEETNANEEQKSEKKRKRKLEEDEDEIKSKKLKKKKKKLAFDNAGLDVNVDEEVCYDNPCLEDLNVTTNGTADLETITKSSSNAFVNLGFNPADESSTKRKKKVTFASPEADDGTKKNDENITEIITEEETPKKSKKKKKKNIEEEKGIDNPACEVLNFDETIQNEEEEEEVKPKKSKKKNKNKDESINNESCEVTNGEEIGEDTSNDSETPKKAKKKSKKQRQEETDTLEDETETSKKSKKKTKKVENGIDNLACVVNIVEEGVASINSAIDNYQNELENEINERKADMKSRTPNKKLDKRFDDKKSLKNLVSAGQLRVNFSGANLDKIPGYGVEI